MMYQAVKFVILPEILTIVFGQVRSAVPDIHTVIDRAVSALAGRDKQSTSVKMQSEVSTNHFDSLHDVVIAKSLPSRAELVNIEVGLA